MAGTWMSIVRFWRMRENDTLNFSPKIPKQWEGYSFKSILETRL
jgi:maltose phosphorylase